MNSEITHEDVVALINAIKELSSKINCTNLDKIDMSIGKPLIDLTNSVNLLAGVIEEK